MDCLESSKLPSDLLSSVMRGKLGQDAPLRISGQRADNAIMTDMKQ